jgi:hypothetical protein
MENIVAEPAVYESIDLSKLEQIRNRHRWITEPLYRASWTVLNMPFFDWVGKLRSAKQFKPAAEQLYYHSATFPKVMGLMLGTTPMTENHMMHFYAKHAYGEVDHHQMLLLWMLRHRFLDTPDDIRSIIPTPATNACVNLAYQLAIEADRYKWILTINSGIERCSNDFFKAVSKKMHEIGASDEYFDVHVEADEHHSIMGMEYLEPQDPDSVQGRQLIAKALEGISLWAAMLHSWIGIEMFPTFNLDGTIVAKKLAS